jgi:hypothetical protein
MKEVVQRLYRARNLFITSSPGIGVTIPSSISLSRRSASSAHNSSILFWFSVEALKQMFCRHGPRVWWKRERGANYFFVGAHRFL